MFSKYKSEPVVVLDSVSYRYPTLSSFALNSVSLTIGPGEFVLLVGGSSSGKSTLLRTIAGLVPHFYGGEFGGRAVIDGMDTRKHGLSSLSAVLGWVGQDPETQVIMGTIYGELALVLESRGRSKSYVGRAVEEISLTLGISHLLDRTTSELSGGELQRVALAAALITRPKLLLLDEPTSQLDPVSGDEFLSLLRRVNEDWGTTIILAEHRIERCLSSADRVVAMKDSGIVFDGEVDEYPEWTASSAPNLQTMATKMFIQADLHPLPISVKDARRVLSPLVGTPDLCCEAENDATPIRSGAGTASTSLQPFQSTLAEMRKKKSRISPWRSRHVEESVNLSFRRVWFDYRGSTVLKDIDLTLDQGKAVALMGRNGAGKSTLLKLAAGIMAPSRGRVEVSGEVKLLVQNPGDHFVYDSVEKELNIDRPSSNSAVPSAPLRGFLRRDGEISGAPHDKQSSPTDNSLKNADLFDRHPKDLSGGERQNLAIEKVMRSLSDRASVILLDEPTRGFDRAQKSLLAYRIKELTSEGLSIMIATHDPEFAGQFADEVYLLGKGTNVASGPAKEILSGGIYFATETARILNGYVTGIIDPKEGADWIRSQSTGTRFEAIGSYQSDSTDLYSSGSTGSHLIAKPNEPIAR